MQILNSPAAVSFMIGCRQTTNSHWKSASGKAPGNRNKSEDLPCTVFITAFEEKALSLMKRANRPIISFIHSASKKVRNNKLCQVYLNANLMGITLAFFVYNALLYCILQNLSLFLPIVKIIRFKP